jgi:hypothetical protein
MRGECRGPPHDHHQKNAMDAAVRSHKVATAFGCTGFGPCGSCDNDAGWRRLCVGVRSDGCVTVAMSARFMASITATDSGRRQASHRHRITQRDRHRGGASVKATDTRSGSTTASNIEPHVDAAAVGVVDGVDAADA